MNHFRCIAAGTLLAVAFGTVLLLQPQKPVSPSISAPKTPVARSGSVSAHSELPNPPASGTVPAAPVIPGPETLDAMLGTAGPEALRQTLAECGCPPAEAEEMLRKVSTRWMDRLYDPTGERCREAARVIRDLPGFLEDATVRDSWLQSVAQAEIPPDVRAALREAHQACRPAGDDAAGLLLWLQASAALADANDPWRDHGGTVVQFLAEEATPAQAAAILKLMQANPEWQYETTEEAVQTIRSLALSSGVSDADKAILTEFGTLPVPP